MNKRELISLVSSRSGLSQADAARAVDALFDAIVSALKRGDEVTLVGFGTFSVARRLASTGRNPRTGEAIRIQPSKLARFRPGKGLREAVSGGDGDTDDPGPGIKR
jgi:DNA-binding protein HU-beta